jgi:hypothetical protein
MSGIFLLLCGVTVQSMKVTKTAWKSLLRDNIKMDCKQKLAPYLIQCYTDMNTMMSLIAWVPHKAARS